MLLSLYISMCNLRRFYLHYVVWSYTKLEFYFYIMFSMVKLVELNKMANPLFGWVV